VCSGSERGYVCQANKFFFLPDPLHTRPRETVSGPCPDRVKPGPLSGHGPVRVGHGRTVSDKCRARVRHVPDMDTAWVWPCTCLIGFHIQFILYFSRFTNPFSGAYFSEDLVTVFESVTACIANNY